MITHECRLTFASENVTEGLFKFRACGTKKELDRVNDILRGNLYFSTCEQLNDPFEFRLRLQIEPRKNVRLSGVHRAMKASKVIDKMPPAKRLERAAQLANRLENNQEVLGTAVKRHYERMKSDCFIFCVSATRFHPLLWSHYVDSHNGVCIQLDHKLLPLAGASRVDKHAVWFFLTVFTVYYAIASYMATTRCWAYGANWGIVAFVLYCAIGGVLIYSLGRHYRLATQTQ